MRVTLEACRASSGNEARQEESADHCAVSFPIAGEIWRVELQELGPVDALEDVQRRATSAIAKPTHAVHRCSRAGPSAFLPVETLPVVEDEAAAYATTFLYVVRPFETAVDAERQLGTILVIEASFRGAFSPYIPHRVVIALEERGSMDMFDVHTHSDTDGCVDEDMPLGPFGMRVKDRLAWVGVSLPVLSLEMRHLGWHRRALYHISKTMAVACCGVGSSGTAGAAGSAASMARPASTISALAPNSAQDVNAMSPSIKTPTRTSTRPSSLSSSTSSLASASQPKPAQAATQAATAPSVSSPSAACVQPGSRSQSGSTSIRASSAEEVSSQGAEARGDVASLAPQLAQLVPALLATASTTDDQGNVQEFWEDCLVRVDTSCRPSTSPAVTPSPSVAAPPEMRQQKIAGETGMPLDMQEECVKVNVEEAEILSLVVKQTAAVRAPPAQPDKAATSTEAETEDPAAATVIQVGSSSFRLPPPVLAVRRVSELWRPGTVLVVVTTMHYGTPLFCPGGDCASGLVSLTPCGSKGYHLVPLYWQNLAEVTDNVGSGRSALAGRWGAERRGLSRGPTLATHIEEEDEELERPGTPPREERLQSCSGGWMGE